jgi:predicted Fe-Mo cluster-binding NifX family protein
MKIAIASNNNEVSAHFGRCQEYHVFEIEDHEIISDYKLENPGHQPGFLPKYLAEKNIDTIISGGMGKKAQDLFNRNNIKAIIGASGDTTAVAQQVIEGNLSSTAEPCNHDHDHDHGHHDC